MNNELNNIKTIQNQEKIRILFIILNLFALYADKEVEKSLKNKNFGNTNLSNQIYLEITFVNVLVLIYYILINNKALCDAKENNKPTNIFEIKNTAFVLSIIAVVLFIYVQLTSTNQNNKNTQLY